MMKTKSFYYGCIFLMLGMAACGPISPSVNKHHGISAGGIVSDMGEIPPSPGKKDPFIERKTEVVSKKEEPQLKRGRFYKLKKKEAKTLISEGSVELDGAELPTTDLPTGVLVVMDLNESEMDAKEEVQALKIQISENQNGTLRLDLESDLTDAAAIDKHMEKIYLLFKDSTVVEQNEVAEQN